MAAGRPRSFDRDSAMLVAMECFWRDGYDATTVAKLTEAIGIAPPSLYAAFGDKDQLFQAAADLYFTTISAQFDALLALPTFRESVAEMLRVSAGAHTNAATPPGCFMATEPRLADRRELLRARLAARAEQGIADGDVPADSDPRRLAEFVMAVHSGMSARARDGATTAEVMAIAETALAALPGGD